MRRLETQADGRRFAVEVLRRLNRESPEKCRANLPPPFVHQCDVLHKALAELKERGTIESVVGFAAILTDLAGTRAPEGLADLYAQMERCGQIRPYRLKRLLNDGHRIAALAVERQAQAALQTILDSTREVAEAADNAGSGNGDRMPAKAEPAT